VGLTNQPTKLGRLGMISKRILIERKETKSLRPILFTWQ
jgi:hypothetical protein